jgi:hypothetical protein
LTLLPHAAAACTGNGLVVPSSSHKQKVAGSIPAFMLASMKKSSFFTLKLLFFTLNFFFTLELIFFTLEKKPDLDIPRWRGA